VRCAFNPWKSNYLATQSVELGGGSTPATAFAGENQCRKTDMPYKQVRHARTKLQAKAPRGRPPVHREAWAKVSVVLFERQVAKLDRLTKDVRRKSGKTMTRAEVIRALIDGLIRSRMDVAAHASEATLRSHVARRLASRGA
jgi:hypothetical protein